MSAQSTAQTYYRRNAALLVLAARQIARQFGRPADAARMTGQFQAAAAALALAASAQALEESDTSPAGAAVAAAGFLGSFDALTGLYSSAPSPEALAQLASLLVADSGRSAAGVFTASRDTEVGWIRFLNGDSCERCAILAGRFYRWSRGFERHPQCDCVMLPAASEQMGHDLGLISDPREAFDKGLIRGLSQAQTQAIKDGADMNQVVNAQRGMRMVNFSGQQVRTTTEGMTRRGLAGSAARRRGASLRLTPESIYRLATSREEAIEFLRLHGYLL